MALLGVIQPFGPANVRIDPSKNLKKEFWKATKILPRPRTVIDIINYSVILSIVRGDHFIYNPCQSGSDYRSNPKQP